MFFDKLTGWEVIYQ